MILKRCYNYSVLYSVLRFKYLVSNIGAYSQWTFLGDMVAILNSIVSNSYYGMLRR